MIAKLFYIAIAFGLFFNLLGDASVYRQDSTDRETSKWMVQSYRIVQDIDAAKIKVLESQVRKTVAPELNPLLVELQSSLQDLPDQKARVDSLLKLNKTQIIAPRNNLALDILTDLHLAESTLLEERLKSNAISNSNTAKQIMLTNGVDLGFMLIMVAFFFYERRKSTKMQAAMTSALAHVESVNQSLLRKMTKKDSKFKTAVHDLKNPLGSIKGFAELLQDEEGNSLSTMEMLQIIKRISNNTLTLVESVLRSEEDGEDEKDPLHRKQELKVLNCLEETCGFLEPIARNKKQTIQTNLGRDDFLLIASKQKLQDVFYNVISNALKYSPPGSVVLVSNRNEKDQHIIEIRDQGPGFKKEDFPMLFLPGARLSAKPTGGESSSGIGLYSVKHSVESMDATIEIKNNKDRGAIVILRFPRQVESFGLNEANPSLNSEILIN